MFPPGGLRDEPFLTINGRYRSLYGWNGECWLHHQHKHILEEFLSESSKIKTPQLIDVLLIIDFKAIKMDKNYSDLSASEFIRNKEM